MNATTNPPVKREREATPPTTTQATSNQTTQTDPDAFAVKRAKIVEEMAKDTGDWVLAPREIAGTHDLMDDEIKECWKIANAAIVSIDGGARATDAAFGKFLDMVFDGWTSGDEVEMSNEEDGEIRRGGHHEEGPVGQIVSRYRGTFSPGQSVPCIQPVISTRAKSKSEDKSNKDVSYAATLNIHATGPSVTFSAKHEDVTVPTRQIENITWVDAERRGQAFTDLQAGIWDTLLCRAEPYNQERAVQYARRMLRQRSLGLAVLGKDSARYRFCNVAVYQLLFPVIDMQGKMAERAEALFDYKLAPPRKQRYSGRAVGGEEDEPSDSYDSGDSGDCSGSDDSSGSGDSDESGGSAS